MATKFLTVALAAAVPALARTDLAGCTTYDTVVSNADGMYATRIWYVPDSGEICDILDCGGGRAPPKTTVPGCPAYEGTETYSPSFIDPKTLGAAPAKETGNAEEDGDVSLSATVTSAPATQTDASGTATATETEAATETESESTVRPIFSSILRKANDTGIATPITTPGHATVTGSASSGAGSGTASSGSDSGSASDADSESKTASAPGSAVSTAGAAMPTAGAFLALAGAAIYAGML
ncbi:siderophore biosynthesis [Fusarium longipes]|uniref:Siderophore biosynthesis n=1 Tax=Fusarium longipes TaxID=694270 RepID=A0A395SUE9_9HYPO|nr:siderophore biosynthesis [Fusarium longipes]